MRKLISLFLLIPALVYSQKGQIRSIDSTFTLKTFITAGPEVTMRWTDNIWIWTDTTEFTQALRLKELTVIPGTPKLGIGRLYVKDSDSKLYFKDDSGTESDLTAGAGSGDVTKVGTPVNDEIGVWTGDGTLEGDTNFQWSGTNLIIGGGATASRLRMLEASGSGTNYTEFVVVPQAANIAYSLPPDDGDSGEQLQTDGAGVLTWEASGGVGTDDIVGGSGITVTDGANTISGGDATVAVDLAASFLWTDVHTFENGEFRILNPARTFTYRFGSTAIAQTLNVNLPVLIASDFFTFDSHTSALANKTLISGSITSGFGNIDVGASSIAAGSFDASDGNIGNVGQLDVDTIIGDGATLVLGDNTETIQINSSDWDISTTGAMTGFSFDANGTGNSLSNVDLAADVTGNLPDGNIPNNITIDLANVSTLATVTDNESTAEENPIVFVAGADPDGGTLGLETDGNATYNPSTGTITATEFVGGGVGITGVTASHAGTITWTGTSILESGVAFGFGDGSDATLTHTYANTGTDVSIAYSTAAMAVTGVLTATNLSNTNTGDEASSSVTVQGIIEVATIAETNTGTDPARAVSPDGLDGWIGSAQVTTLGTIATGVWNGTAVTYANLNFSNNIVAGDIATSAVETTEILDGTVSVEDVQPELDNRTISYSIIDTVKALDLFRIHEFNYAITIDSVVTNTDAGTHTFNIEHRAHTTPRSAGTDVLTADIVADAFESNSTFDDATIPANRPLYHVGSAVSGGADRVDVTIFYKID